MERGGGWVLAQNALTLAALALAPMFRGRWNNTTTAFAGVTLLVVGAWFGIAGVRALGRNLTPFPKPRESSKLVRHGVYALVRHPLYSSLMSASAGWALLWGSGMALAMSVALALVLRAKALSEERWLRERYPEYRDYERHVKRFVPGLW